MVASDPLAEVQVAQGAAFNDGEDVRNFLVVQVEDLLLFIKFDQLRHFYHLDYLCFPISHLVEFIFFGKRMLYSISIIGSPAALNLCGFGNFLYSEFYQSQKNRTTQILNNTVLFKFQVLNLMTLVISSQPFG